MSKTCRAMGMHTANILPAGTSLQGRYKILNVLARGRDSAVYQAVDMEKGRAVAIKQLRISSDDPEYREKAFEQFREQFKVLARLRHINLPRVLDYFTDAEVLSYRSRQYFVMEFVQATSLENVMKGLGGPAREGTIFIWLKQLLDVLHYLHTRPSPVIFRDLRPANVMLAGDGYLKLIDFGISKLHAAGEETTRFRTVSTWAYSPPEQTLTRSNARTDIYALGATLYFLATSKDPPEARVRLQQSVPLKNIHAVNPSISKPLEETIYQMMSLQPGERPASIKDIKRHLGRLLWGIKVVPMAAPLEAVAAQQQEASKMVADEYRDPS